MNDPFLKYLKLLRKKQVKFLVIGGFASVLYGVPRATFDLDLLVLPEESNIEKLLKVFYKFGFKKVWVISKGSKKPKLLGSLKTVSEKIIFKKWAVRFVNSEIIDVLLYADANLFNAFWNGRQEIKLGKFRIPCASLPDLIQLKKWSNRSQDQFDLIYLNQIRRTRYIRRKV